MILNCSTVTLIPHYSWNTKVNPKGKRLPLFGVSRSNLVESEMSAALATGIRHSTPPRAFQIWINQVQEKYAEFHSAITQASIG